MTVLLLKQLMFNDLVKSHSMLIDLDEGERNIYGKLGIGNQVETLSWCLTHGMSILQINTLLLSRLGTQ